ncbi:MAG: alpha-glucan phosphorylase [Desulfobulbaceae bacterium A2]|nr:MAG: alpha-glucan phosphorylase [Desulfobulbaceae bacterium A2]
MPAFKPFTVTPNIPPALVPLQDIARNFWWSWTPEAIALFRSMDPGVWKSCRHNPVRLLGLLRQERLEQLAADEEFVARVNQLQRRLTEYLQCETWCKSNHGDLLGLVIAYFSLEFGLHESLPIYSGGLGILAGDHLKSASELGLPLVGVGLLYRHGYFEQRLNAEGWQEELYPRNIFEDLPIFPVLQQGQPLVVSVPLPGTELHARVWRAQVGRNALYLLDSDLPQNTPEMREITGYLYGGDQQTRIRQELLLGVGGVRALRALGIAPTVCHMNEGHAAFMALERIRTMERERKLSHDTARQLVSLSSIFTTHTPVPAGIDRFSVDLVRANLSAYAGELSLPLEEIIRLGQEQSSNPQDPFSMAVLALRLSGFANGVSELHGRVSRAMWRGLWPKVPEQEIPIGHVTNGVHTNSWFSQEIARVYNRYLGQNWFDDPVDRKVWQQAGLIPDQELWECRQREKQRLITHVRENISGRHQRHSAHPVELREVEQILDPNVLTIGFARRFATYKRANLILRDLPRLRAMVQSERPVQFVFAGKAHPADQQGKQLIQELVQRVRREGLHRSVVFLENYNIDLARRLVQGVDVWLNTPRRPLEASGTSGMKAAVNGVLNLSIADGWWCEGYNGANGWNIGNSVEYRSPEEQDEAESRDLYDLLEHVLAPMYYERDLRNIPVRWMAMVKNAIMSLCPVYNTNRMVEEYTERYYLPSVFQYHLLEADNHAEARALTQWERKLRGKWSEVAIQQVECDTSLLLKSGDSLPIRVQARLGGLEPQDVQVEAYFGRGGATNGEMSEPDSVVLRHEGSHHGVHEFSGAMPCVGSGRYLYSVRVLPSRPTLPGKFHLGLIHWWEG